MIARHLKGFPARCNYKSNAKVPASCHLISVHSSSYSRAFPSDQNLTCGDNQSTALTDSSSDLDPVSQTEHDGSEIPNDGEADDNAIEKIDLEQPAVE